MKRCFLLLITCLLAHSVLSYHDEQFQKRVLIIGVTGQDGAYLAELLLDKGYQVHGIKRRSSSFNTGRIDHLYEDLHRKPNRLILHYGDVIIYLHKVMCMFHFNYRYTLRR